MSEYDLSVVRCENYDDDTVKRALEEALSAIDGLSMIKPGMKVAIKANLVMTKKPEAAATTHPALITALTRMLVGRGASVVIGDSPGGPFNSGWLSAVYQATGMKQAEEAGAKLNRNFSHNEADNPEGKVLHDFTYTAYLDDADVIIDFAKLKTHGMVGMTGAVKNMFGAIPGTMKPEYHCRFPKADKFSDMLIDLYEYFKPVLSIVDGVYGMEGNGPTAGTPRYIGTLIASKSAYLCDLAGAKIMGLPTEQAFVLERSIARGLCPENLDSVRVYGDVEQFIQPDYGLIEPKSEYDTTSVFPKGLRTVMHRVFRAKPVLVPEKCVGCEVCKNTCPQKVIRMVDNKPKFKYKNCIRCFCCQEFCPKGALVVKKRGIAKLLNRL